MFTPTPWTSDGILARKESVATTRKKFVGAFNFVMQLLKSKWSETELATRHSQ